MRERKPECPALPDILCFRDPEGRCLFTSNGGVVPFHPDSENAAIPPEPLRACSRFDAVCHGDLTELWRTGKVVRGEEIMECEDGSRYLFDITKIPVFAPDGRPHCAVTICCDRTGHREARLALQESESDLRTILDSVHDAVIIHSSNGCILDVNSKMLDLYGVTREEAFQYNIARDYSAPENPLTDLPAFWTRVMEGRSHFFRWKARRPHDGTTFDVEVALSPVQLRNRRAILATVRDIRERVEAESKIELFERLFENALEGISITDLSGKILSVNPAFTTITGYSPEEVVGKNPRVLKSDRHDPEFYRRMWESIRTLGSWRGEIWNRRKNGEAYPEWLSISAVRDMNGRTMHYAAVFHDITDIKRSEERIRHQAYHDALTELPNRVLFNDRLEMALAHAKRENRFMAVILLDLDRFKHINDSLGYAVGDLLLQETARRLRSTASPDDTVARLGGDEFVILVEDLPAPRFAVHAAQNVFKAFAEPFSIKGHELYISPGVGITIYPSDGETRETLLRNAEVAMYRAKEQGGNGFRLFTESMNEGILTRITMENSLRRALEQEEFILHYQPRIDLVTGQVTGMEALVRWVGADGKLIPPLDFIPLCEETGFIAPLGEWVIREACRQSALWLKEGLGELAVAVNLSVRQFRTTPIEATVRKILEETGLPSRLLEIEITESALMTDVENAVDTMKALTSMGIRFSLDDFGTGYSSLSYLRRLPLHCLKIDKSFVQDIGRDKDADSIVSAIVSMAHSLNLKVVAEGVESEEQLEFLRGLGYCREIQGYIFSRPLPPREFEIFVTEGLNRPVRTTPS